MQVMAGTVYSHPLQARRRTTQAAAAVIVATAEAACLAPVDLAAEVMGRRREHPETGRQARLIQEVAVVGTEQV